MAVLKSPRNNKKKKKWSLQYLNTFKSAIIPQIQNPQLRFIQESHQKLSTTRLENDSRGTVGVQTSSHWRLSPNVPFTKRQLLKTRPHYWHFRTSDSTRRVGYPLFFNSIA